MFCQEMGEAIPKLYLTIEGEMPPSFEESNEDANRTMCVSWIGDSEM